MYDDEGIKINDRYTIMYYGYLFDGDSLDELNIYGYDDWHEVASLINMYGDMIIVHDNEYDVTWQNGEWY